MAKYVDGFVLVVPKNKAEEYKKMAESAVAMTLSHRKWVVRKRVHLLKWLEQQVVIPFGFLS